jgi:hypothetical protein
VSSAYLTRAAIFLAGAISLVAPLSAQEVAIEDEALPARYVSVLGGVDLVPNLKWSAKAIVNNNYMNYAFEDSSLIGMTGKLVNTQLGLSLGVDASIDNNKVNKAYKIGTSLGYKKFMLRVQSGSLEGKASWNDGFQEQVFERRCSVFSEK